ncbi:hypothetical protein PCE1_001595 [Barthelona sp. PCE]
MSFQNYKRGVLERMQTDDRSKAGGIDILIRPLCEAFNAMDDYVTLSSCSGRICLLHQTARNQKNQCEWPITTHELANHVDFAVQYERLIYDDDTEYSNERLLTLRLEDIILHVACANIDLAKKLMNKFSQIGYKKQGIISVKNNRAVVELRGSNHYSMPLIIGNDQIVPIEAFESLIRLCNDRMTTGHTKLAELTEHIVGILSES